MSIFYHNDDPLLRRTLFQPTQPNNVIQQQNPSVIADSYAQLYKQQMYNELAKQQMGNANSQRDWLSELNVKMQSIDSSSSEILSRDEEFTTLNAQLQSTIQSELMNIVKIKLNGSQDVVDNIKKQIEIIDKVVNKSKQEQNQNMMEINDYIKNYSNLTFDEYKRMKNGNETEVVEANIGNNNSNKTKVKK